MGISMSSRDTRRISFDNTLAISNSAVVIPKYSENESIVEFDDLSPEITNEIIFSDTTNDTEAPDERDIDYWAHRIENLKKEHLKINNIVEKEYIQQLEKTNGVFEPPIVTHEKISKLKPCFDWRNKILKCYEENPHQPLVCSPIVQAFSTCVASCTIEDKI